MKLHASADEHYEKRPALIMLSYILMVLMTLSDLYTTAAISAGIWRRHYFPYLPVAISKCFLWISWLCLPAGISLLAIKWKLKLALGLTVLGFVSAISLLAWDVRHPLGGEASESWDIFGCGYLTLFGLSLVGSIYAYACEKSVADSA